MTVPASANAPTADITGGRILRRDQADRLGLLLLLPGSRGDRTHSSYRTLADNHQRLHAVVMRNQQYCKRRWNALTAVFIAAAPEVAAQSLDPQEPTQQPRQVVVPRSITVPGYGEVYIVPKQPKDTRTAKQRCLDDEAKRIDGPLSELDKASIDLKCSQR